MVSAIKIVDDTVKARFDNVQRILSYRKKANLDQTETLSEVLAFWEVTNIKETEI